MMLPTETLTAALVAVTIVAVLSCNGVHSLVVLNDYEEDFDYRCSAGEGVTTFNGDWNKVPGSNSIRFPGFLPSPFLPLIPPFLTPDCMSWFALLLSLNFTLPYLLVWR